jgi:hypothetical protein
VYKPQDTTDTRPVVIAAGSAIIYIDLVAVPRGIMAMNALITIKQPLVRNMIPSIPNGMALPK